MRIAGVKSRKGIRGWQPSQNEIYIGRPGPWGNPYAIMPQQSRETALRRYEEHLREKLREDPDFLQAFQELDGKTLVCWCVPQPVPAEHLNPQTQEVCHGEVMMRLARDL